jgi:succinate-acetate transporter protein
LIKLTGAPGSLSDPLGLLLLVAAAAMVIPAIGALGGKGVATVVLFTTALRFASTGVYELSGSEGWGDAAGVVGLVLCALALAAALAMLLKDARGDAAAEPGVRPQL